jgi:metal-responsive CopG/Arc/MetJ family transcriptional regulator
MFFSSIKKVKIDKDLYQRLEKAAQEGGYSSTDELIRHVLEREIDGTKAQSEQDEAERQLRGLGYIE